MKRFTALFLALALAFSLGIPALAADPEDPDDPGQEQVASFDIAMLDDEGNEHYYGVNYAADGAIVSVWEGEEERTDITAIPGVSYSYDAATGQQTLTLSGAELTHLNIGYEEYAYDEDGNITGTVSQRLPSSDLNLVLEGSSTIHSGDAWTGLFICDGVNVTITGNGSLEVSDDVEVSDDAGSALYVASAGLTLKSGNLKLTGSNAFGATFESASFTQTGGSIDASADFGTCLNFWGGSEYTMTGGSASYTGLWQGVWQMDGSVMTLSGGSFTAKAAATVEEFKAYNKENNTYRSGSGYVILDGTLTVTGGSHAFLAAEDGHYVPDHGDMAGQELYISTGLTVYGGASFQGGTTRLVGGHALMGDSDTSGIVTISDGLSAVSNQSGQTLRLVEEAYTWTGEDGSTGEAWYVTFTEDNQTEQEDGSNTAGDVTISAASVDDTPVRPPVRPPVDDDDTPSIPSTTTETEENPDGSTTTTTTNNRTGTTTEVTEYEDGSTTTVVTEKDGTVTTTEDDGEGNVTTVVEAADGTVTITEEDAAGNVTETVEDPNGTVTTTETTADGSVTETVESPDGSVAVNVELANGTTAETAITADGVQTSSVAVSTQAVVQAGEYGESITLPIPEVEVTRNAEIAPTVTVDLPVGSAATVEVPVDNVTSGTVAVIVYEDGTEKVVMNCTPTENGLSVPLEGGATIKIVDNSKDFPDVDETHWAKDAVDFASARGLLQGDENGFSGNGLTTRGQLMTILARLDGQDTTFGEGELWYGPGMDWAKEKGISDGSNPEGNISRQELAVMLWRYAGSPASTQSVGHFTDADEISSWATEAVRWCVETGILGGWNNAVNPGATATRNEAATMLMRYCSYIAAQASN